MAAQVPPPPRPHRRVTGKSAHPEFQRGAIRAAAVVAAPAAPAAQPVVLGVRHYPTIWADLDPSILVGGVGRSRNTYLVMYRRIKKWLADAALDIQRVRLSDNDRMVLEGNTAWKTMTVPRKGDLIRYCIETTSCGVDVIAWLSQRWPLVKAGEEDEKAIRVQSVLLTWQGSWGLLKDFPRNCIVVPGRMWAFGCVVTLSLLISGMNSMNGCRTI